jgi:hypothetical protein
MPVANGSLEFGVWNSYSAPWRMKFVLSSILHCVWNDDRRGDVKFEVIAEQDRQCTYNLTLRRVLATIVAVEKQCVTYSESVCSFSYPACNALSLYCHQWPVWLYIIFPHYLINGTIFGKKLPKKVFFYFLYNLCMKHFAVCIHSGCIHKESIYIYICAGYSFSGLYSVL